MDETGWLIESAHLGSPHWWNGVVFDDDNWTRDSLQAIRFARREDAERIIRYFGWTEAVAAEHAWGD